MRMVTKTFTITAPEDTMDKFEAFLCFFHYNGGHSGLFGMPFDGDGHESMKIEPPPARSRGAQRIADAGTELEIAAGNGVFRSYKVVRDPHYYAYEDGKLLEKNPNGQTIKVCRNYKEYDV